MNRPLTEDKKQEIVDRVLTARANREQFLSLMKQRQEEGFNIAKKCAYLLKQKYGVAKVILFGSLLNHEKMTLYSDIDLAVSNLSEKDYFRAIADLDSGHNFEIDLVEIQKASPHILEAIHQGVEL
ncbi:nucleotidyltransferase family protein [Crocosphaera sp. Alani8]|uniref:nucleotidyltransferase family protein n=1 Tax=Crocosphaera sp. Alani8 TaxID=3038952 RepID=UPI00313B12B1